jgi:serine/threonine protein kinase
MTVHCGNRPRRDGDNIQSFLIQILVRTSLKVINSPFNSETARQRFPGSKAARLGHPNVATVFHPRQLEGAFYYAMEMSKAESSAVQREGPLPSDLALRVTRQVSRALIAADRQKLVHRSPSNIMLVDKMRTICW